MAEILTSYLNAPVPWIDLNVVRARVCLWVHQGQADRFDISYPELFPTKQQLKDAYHKTDVPRWESTYRREILSKIDPHLFVDNLPEKVVLLCHEKCASDGHVVCHRRIVAGWIEEETGIVVPEWLPPDKRAKVNQIQTLMEF